MPFPFCVPEDSKDGGLKMSDPQSRSEAILQAIIDGTEYNEEPQSRNEAILISILNNTEYTDEPQSRMEELLLELKNSSTGGTFAQLDTDNYVKVLNDEKFGTNGKLSNVLGYKTYDTCYSNMLEGWNSNKGATYDVENSIGAYAGYSFGKAVYIEEVRAFLGKYVSQGITLYADIEYLNADNEWVTVETVDISGAGTSYPVNCVIVPIQQEVYGVRWIHQKTPNKTSGTTITFFGLCLYGYNPA